MIDGLLSVCSALMSEEIRVKVEIRNVRIWYKFVSSIKRQASRYQHLAPHKKSIR